MRKTLAAVHSVPRFVRRPSAVRFAAISSSVSPATQRLKISRTTPASPSLGRSCPFEISYPSGAWNPRIPGPVLAFWDIPILTRSPICSDSSWAMRYDVHDESTHRGRGVERFGRGNEVLAPFPEVVHHVHEVSSVAVDPVHFDDED